MILSRACTYLFYGLLLTLLGCGQNTTESADDAGATAQIDGASDVASNDAEDVGVPIDSEVDNARECEAWFDRNQELAKSLAATTVAACEVGSYGRCGEGQLMEIDCGIAQHSWCGSTNQNDTGERFSAAFAELMTERCLVAPAGCQRATQNDCTDHVPFCMPDGQCLLLEGRNEGDCEDIRSEVFSSPSTARDALCDHPDRVCRFSSYPACYSDQCRNQCPIENRFACVDNIAVAEGQEVLICAHYTPLNCEGFNDLTGANVCEIDGEICIESYECGEDICGEECMATICIDGSWTEVPRREYASDCQ